jgi:acyl-coenzyme A synthetase/AMP-(fatty) acid ligase
MGKAIPGVQIEVVREDGSLCAPDEPGELIHRGALIARGYWNNPDKTASVYRPNPLLPPENRFLETVVYSGDLVKKDKEGFLYYVGRKDNMIKISGYRVSPTEVEELLASSGLIAESVAFGVPDDELGYRIRAVVVFKGDEQTGALLEHCRKNAPSYLVPGELFPVSSFPKTASGKIDRPAIVKEFSLDA